MYALYGKEHKMTNKKPDYNLTWTGTVREYILILNKDNW
jgi:hypothetical protein